MTNRFDGGAGPSVNTRGSHTSNANVNANTNTHTMMTTTNMHTQTGTTTTATTNQTGMTDKPKTRKKDKPPRIPPPDQIYDNTTKTSYTRGPALGEGGFASCYIISDQKKHRYAAKVIQKSDLPTFKTRQKLFAEIKIHQGLTHENIVKYYHCFEDDDFVYLVLEMCECKTLMELIKRRKRLTEPEVRYYMKEITAACSYLHRSASVIHRDLKLGNIFLTNDMHVRIGDFGLATLIVKDERKKTICGTPNYIAPEILFDTDNGHSFEVDIWSIGVIMYTLLVGKPPFQTNEVKAIYKKIRDNNYVFPDDIPISEEAKSLVAALLTPTPASRPSVEDVLSHPFFTSGYCPTKLDKSTLQTAPNFDEEIRLLQELEEQMFEQEQAEQPESEHIKEEFEADNQYTHQQGKERLSMRQRVQQRQQLLYDQSSFGIGSPTEEPIRRLPDQKQESVNQLSNLPRHANTPNNNNRISNQPTDQARYIPSRSSPLGMQVHQPGPQTNPRLQYGEQVKMEMVEGDRITSEIRTVNVNRGRSAASIQQYTLDNGRVQYDHQFKQKVLAAVASLTAGDISAPSFHQGNNTEPIEKREQMPSRSAVIQHTQLSTAQPSFSRQDSRIPSIPLQPSPNNSTSRLPVPRSRLATAASGSEQTMSSLNRNGLSNPFASTSPRPPSAMTLGSSTAIRARQQQDNENQNMNQRSSSPLSINRRRSADIVNPSNGSTVGISSRQQESLMSTDMRRTATDESQSKREYRGQQDMNFMDIDMDMDVDYNQHLDLVIGNMSDAIPSPVRLSDNEETSKQQEHSQQNRSSTSTIIQTVQGVERPASAMQRTFSQERELSDMNRALESPRKISRTLYSHSTEPLSASRGSAGFSAHSQPQSQQHSFLQSSQQESLSQTSKQQTPQSQLRHLQSPRHISSSPSLRMAARSSRQWPTGSIGLGLDNQGSQGTSQTNGASSISRDIYDQKVASEESTSRSEKSIPREGSVQKFSSSQFSQKSSSSKSQQHVGLGLGGTEDSRMNGTATSGQNDVLMTDADALGRSHLNPSQQLQQSKNNVVEDPYRYQINSATQLRAPRANQQVQALQQASQSHTQSPRGVASSSFSSSNSYSREQNQGDNSNNGEGSFQNQRPEQSTSEIEESSVDQSHAKEAFEAKRQLQTEIRRRVQRSSQSRPVSGQDQDHVQEQEERRRQSKQLDSPEGVGSSVGANNNPNKQSNETTMAGMSSGGNSDEHDHVEVPSTSYVTTTSMSLSMHHDHPHHQKQPQQPQQPQQQQQQQPQQQPQQPQDKLVRRKSKSSRSQKQGSCGLEFLEEMRLDPVGYCEEVEKHLRSMIRARKEGVLSNPTMESTPPRAPMVFLTRWINYERYGVGWHLTNGVMGVLFNDKNTLAMSPNGVDLEIIEPSLRIQKEAKRAADKIKGRKENSSNKVDPKPSSAASSITSNGITHSVSPIKQTLAESMSELRAVLELEKEDDGDGDYPMMRIYDGENNVVKPTPTINRSSSIDVNSTAMDTLDGTTLTSRASNSRRGERSKDDDEDDDEDFYHHFDRWDNAKFLARLSKTNCRINRYPSKFEKKVKVLQGFKNYMIQLLSLLSWGYEDTRLTHGLPFLTDFFRRHHVLSRLSNGIVQVNFADHTKLVLSEHGQVLTFIDNDERPRRVTMTVHQALVPDYFYDVDDAADQDTTIQMELDQIRRHHNRQGSKSLNRLGSFIDKRPVFNPERDYDLIIFPRPRLVKKETERLLQQQQNQQQNQFDQENKSPSSSLTKIEQQVRQYYRPTSSLSPTYPLLTGRDACQVPLVDIQVEGPVRICSMTFMQLHFELVRRLRLALNLLNERRMLRMEEHEKELIEREQQKKDREDNRRRRQERQAQKEKKEKAKLKEEKQEVKQDDFDKNDMEDQQQFEEEGLEERQEEREQHQLESELLSQQL
ncbi:Cell cycle serine/threonine-protein kinase cdc5/MSD2 [Entomortierella lignicola]|nr:Cell cycle serine/threonine-protein kinase cdc5/MSD2 [Entomortierella lignicola]